MRGLVLAVALVASAPLPAAAQAPIDPRATAETKALFANMRTLAQRGVMFGHQNTLAYGYSWTGEPDRSDIRDVTGSYPAVYGWDVMDIFTGGRFDPAKAARLRAWVAQAHGRGGVNSFSWHMDNPVTKGNAWDKTPAVAAIVPGGRLHADYAATLDVVARFFASLKDAKGRPIPVWFRPFHEHTGDWFWWGKPNADAAGYKALWRYTVEHLRDRRGVHNLLWAYSTDVFDSDAAYFEYYPGDGYADMLGYDDYHSIRTAATRATFAARLANLTKWSARRGKIAALTETGVEALPDPTWWTNVLLPVLREPASRGISYVLVWRNANPANDRKDHFYAPYRGQASAADFVRFHADPLTLFEDDLPALYATPAKKRRPPR